MICQSFSKKVQNFENFGGKNECIDAMNTGKTLTDLNGGTNPLTSTAIMSEKKWSKVSNNFIIND